MKKRIRLNNSGSSLVEALISMAVLAFVIVSILGGFTQQQISARNMSARGVAMQLAEMRMEELLKFPSVQLQAETYIDYIIPGKTGFEEVPADSADMIAGKHTRSGDPQSQKQFRRTTEITLDLLGQIAMIRVRVDFPLTDTSYPFKVELKTRRGIK